MHKKYSLSHSLKTRHILMIALGCAIGTGLFLGAGESIHQAGPSILLAYAIGGIMMYFVVRALTEMTVHEPNAGSFSYYANKYIGNYAGFIAGWNYWFNYIIVCMLELTAATMFLDYWFADFPHWISALFILVFFIGINLLNVRLFGEFEFWFAGIKVVTIIALVLFGIYLIFFHQGLNNNVQANISNLWQYGGFFANGINGFLLSFVVVVFAFGGTELVGITAAEAKNPKRIIPLAVNGIIFRIILFYIATLAIIMCLYPWNQITPNVSPFVDVFTKIGISKAATIMNIVVITAALSSFNSGIYGTARMMYSLAHQNNAPRVFGRLNNNGIPYMAVLLSLICIFAVVILNYLYPKKLFLILIAIAAIAAMVNWILILITQIYFRNKVNKQEIGYKMPFFPVASILAIIFFIIIIITMSQTQSMRLAIYIAPAWLIALSLGYFIKTKISKTIVVKKSI